MKKITITLGSNESKFTTMIDDTIAIKVFGDTVSSLLNNSSMMDEPKKETKKDKENAKDSGKVNPDLKAFLDEYEAFVDKYVAFIWWL